MSDQARHETWVGYVIEIACVRKTPSADLLDRASVHSTECALCRPRASSTVTR